MCERLQKVLPIFMAMYLCTWSGCLRRFFDSGTDLESFDSITHHSRHDLTTYVFIIRLDTRRIATFLTFTHHGFCSCIGVAYYHTITSR